jgi:UDP-glucose 4-epimerase
MRIALLGSAGFIGRHVVEALRDGRGHRVVAIDRSAERGSTVGTDHFIEWTPDAIREAVLAAAPRLIIHLAESTARAPGIEAVHAVIRQNLVPAAAVVEAASRCGQPPRIIYLDTGLSYGDNPGPYVETMAPRPANAYALGKLWVVSLLQMASRTAGVDFTILRVSVAYGPGQRPAMFIPSLISSLLRDEPFEMTSGEQLRDFVHVDDLTRAIVAAAESEAARNEILNVASGQPVLIRDAALRIARAAGKSESLLRFGAKAATPDDPTDYRFDISRARRVLGWRPSVDFDDGIRSTLAWYRERLP